jgi:LysM repeat protein
MSALTLAGARPVRTRPSRAVRRARALRLLALLLVLIGLVAAPSVVYMTGRDEAVPTVTHTVAEGDTLWEIASHYRSGEDVRKVVYEIQQANHLSSAIIRPGQVLVIPLPSER